jgi:hypothetical protein
MVERVAMDRPPMYMRVPPRHDKHWRQHCREYNACDERVYFVQGNWYTQEYMPRYQDDRRQYYRDDRRRNRHDHQNDDRGHGRNR